jgi:hypothetical protein
MSAPGQKILAAVRKGWMARIKDLIDAEDVYVIGSINDPLICR